MTIIRKNSFVALLMLLATGTVLAGNPDRLGQAGAFELLINPYAKGTGLHSANTANASGLEAMRLNVAGLTSVEKTEVSFAHNTYLAGSGTNISTIGFGQAIGESGVMGIEAMSMNWGNVPLTTEEVPSGDLGTFRPQFLNLAMAYSQRFSEFISAGVVVRMISQNIANVSASGVALDAGVQYTTGPYNNFRFGVALRNIGTPMTYKGDGISIKTAIGDNSYLSTVNMRVEKFELPSLLHVGMAYDLFATKDNYRVTLMTNFQSNSFSADIYSFGVEAAWKEMLIFRLGTQISEDAEYLGTMSNTYAYDGPAAGLTLQLPTSEERNNAISIDYSYRSTTQFQGTHAVGVNVAF